MSWASLDLVTAYDMGSLEPEAVQASAPWGDTVWSRARAEAKRDLRIWIEADYATVPGVADRVQDAWRLEFVYGTTGGTDTDYRIQAGDDTPSDVPLATVFTTPASDTLEVASSSELAGMEFRLVGTLNAVTSTLTVKYWGPAGWTTLTANDGTSVSSKAFAQSGRVTWSDAGANPINAVRVRKHGGADELFWYQATVSAALTSGVTAAQVLGIRAPEGLKRVAAYLALHHAANGLELQAADPQKWRDKADYYWTKAQNLYAMLRDRGGIPVDYNADQAITPEEPRQYRPVVLRRA